MTFPTPAMESFPVSDPSAATAAVVTALRPHIRSMKGYIPGEQRNAPDVLKLNTNENPYPPSPRVFAALREALTADRLRKYPPPLGDEFRRVAARLYGLEPECFLIGNGSDDLLTILTRAFVPPGGYLAAPMPGYLLYRTLADIQGAVFVPVPFTPDWQLPEPWPVPQAHLTFLANPNSPSGTMVAPAAIRRLAETLAPAPLVLDEAYADFADWNGLSLFHQLPNLIITRSMSKSYSLAGIRFGFAIARPELIRELVKVKDSYNCDILSQTAAVAALEDQDYFQQVRARICATRQRLAEALTRLGFQVTPSQANFVWCRRSDRPVRPIADELARRNILVRYMNYDGYDGLRISIGTEAETDRLLDALQSILAGCSS
ncbi:MAG: histidinol-phosphate transaminase [Thermogemmata sp.]|nr:histidinol-phosphate transaminase [Thermogemmata sp.]